MTTDARWEAVLFSIAAAFVVVGFVVPGMGDSGFTLTARDPAHLRVMTWNVGGTTGRVGSPLRDDALKHVVAVAREADPDILILQEIENPAQFHNVREALGAGRWTAHVSAGGRRVGLFTQRGEASPWFSLGWRTRGLGIRYRDTRGNTVFVAGLHADAYDAGKRNREIGRAVSMFDRSGCGPARILAGDLNLDLDIDKQRGMFTDDEHRDVESYNFVADRMTDAGLGRGATAEPDRRLDYIFVSDRFDVIAAGPLRGRRRGDMDHDPMIADLAWTTTAPPR